MNIRKYIIIYFIFFVALFYAQENTTNHTQESFFIQVKIELKATRATVKNADVFVNGKQFYYSEIKDFYNVEARIGDQLVVSHSDFEDVYYTIKSNEEIKILVEGITEISSKLLKRKNRKQDNYNTYLDSAQFYKKIDIDKSLYFIENAIKSGNSKERNSHTYKVLADIYLHWKQYDLAVTNYKLSNQIKEDLSTKIKLGTAQYLLKKYEESKKTFLEIKDENLSFYQKIIVLESLGDIYFAQKKYIETKKYYNLAFNEAKQHNVTSKLTDVSSKLATVYSAEGKIKLAAKGFNKALNFAKKEDLNRVLLEEEKVAEFLNSSKKYDQEIELRKKSLEKTAQENNSKAKINNEDAVTPQKINYKIGNAYILKEDYKEAISYLEESRVEAKKNKDIVVEKDATRRISEVFSNLGEYDKALKNYQKYVALVDSLYIGKEQEIQQVKRFSKKIADNQNRILSLEKDKELADSKINLAYIDSRLSEESNKSQRIIIYSLIGGFFLMILLVYFMYRNSQQQKIANNLLALKSMRSQMNPHFIFNALNSVNSFIAVNDERNANRYLSEFSTLMRSVLENSDEDFIPFTKELELLELYVKLEHNRFKDKFDYEIKIGKDINLEQFAIPPMLLQPYIENAIWHGLRYRKEKGKLEISMKLKNPDVLSVVILDNGIGRKKSEKLKTKNQLKQKSKGMSTIKNRIAILNSMYKDKISVKVSDALENGEGTKVELILKKN